MSQESKDQGQIPRSNALDSLLERIEERIGEELREPAALVFQIKQLLDAYLEAKAAVAVAKVSEAAEKVGIISPSTAEPVATQSLEDLAKALLALISHLPELRAPPTDIRAEMATEEVDTVEVAAAPLTSLLSVSPGVTRMVDRSEESPSRPATRITAPEVRALWEEFSGIADRLDNEPDAIFKPWAEELACRARALQARGLKDENDVLTRMFRMLTAKAFQRNTRDIFGLALSHRGDWTARADRAKRAREQAQDPSRRALTSRIEIPVSLRAAVVAGAAAENESGPSDFPDVPRLKELCALKPLVLLGGTVEPEKLERLKSLLGKNVDWIETSDGNAQGVSSLADRVRGGRIGAVMVLEELIGHRHFNLVVEAARTSTPLTPVGYGRKAGKGAVNEALAAIEKQLAPKE